MRLTLEQQVHEARIQAAAESLGRAIDRPERKRFKVELYRLLGERDAAVADELERNRMARAKG